MKKNISRNYRKLLCAAIMLLSLVALFVCVIMPSKGEVLNNKVINATKKYLEANNISLRENQKMTAFLPVLQTTGLLEIDDDCLAYSYVEVSGTQTGELDYDINLVCGEPTEMQVTAFDNFLEESSMTCEEKYGPEVCENMDESALNIYTIYSIRDADGYTKTSPINADEMGVLVIFNYDEFINLKYEYIPVSSQGDWEENSKDLDEWFAILDIEEGDNVLSSAEWQTLEIGNTKALYKAFKQNGTDEIRGYKNTYSSYEDCVAGSNKTAECGYVQVEVSNLDRTKPSIAEPVISAVNDGDEITLNDEWYIKPIKITSSCEDMIGASGQDYDYTGDYVSPKKNITCQYAVSKEGSEVGLELHDLQTYNAETDTMEYHPIIIGKNQDGEFESGIYNYTIIATDEAGNEETFVSQVKVDLETPIVEVKVNIPDGTTCNDIPDSPLINMEKEYWCDGPIDFDFYIKNVGPSGIPGIFAYILKNGEEIENIYEEDEVIIEENGFYKSFTLNEDGTYHYLIMFLNGADVFVAHNNELADWDDGYVFANMPFHVMKSKPTIKITGTEYVANGEDTTFDVKNYTNYDIVTDYFIDTQAIDALGNNLQLTAIDPFVLKTGSGFYEAPFYATDRFGRKTTLTLKFWVNKLSCEVTNLDDLEIDNYDMPLEMVIECNEKIKEPIGWQYVDNNHAKIAKTFTANSEESDIIIMPEEETLTDSYFSETVDGFIVNNIVTSLPSIIDGGITGEKSDPISEYKVTITFNRPINTITDGWQPANSCITDEPCNTFTKTFEYPTDDGYSFTVVDYLGRTNIITGVIVTEDDLAEDDENVTKYGAIKAMSYTYYTLENEVLIPHTTKYYQLVPYTNQNIDIVIEFNDEVKTLPNKWDFANEEHTKIRITVTKNGDYSLTKLAFMTLTDFDPITISIDRIGKKLTVTGNGANDGTLFDIPTNNPVNVVLTSNNEILSISSDLADSNWKNDLFEKNEAGVWVSEAVTYSAVTTETLTIRDIYGNVRTIKIKIRNIDISIFAITSQSCTPKVNKYNVTKEDIVCTVRFSKNIVEPIITTGGVKYTPLIEGKKLTLKFTESNAAQAKNFIIKSYYGDAPLTLTLDLMRIDREKPTIEIKNDVFKNNKGKVNKIVTYLVSNEPLQKVGNSFKLLDLSDDNNAETINNLITKGILTEEIKTAKVENTVWVRTFKTSEAISFEVKDYAGNIEELDIFANIEDPESDYSAFVTYAGVVDGKPGDSIDMSKKPYLKEVAVTIKANAKIDEATLPEGESLVWTCAEDGKSCWTIINYSDEFTFDLNLIDSEDNPHQFPMSFTIENVDNTSLELFESHSNELTNKAIKIYIYANKELDLSDSAYSEWDENDKVVDPESPYNGYFVYSFLYEPDVEDTSDNHTFELELSDKYGNTDSVSVTINNYNIVALGADYTFDDTLTNNNVNVSITTTKLLNPDDAINKGIIYISSFEEAGVTYYRYVKEFSNNVTDNKITLIDIWGNEKEITINISNIDKGIPTVIVENEAPSDWINAPIEINLILSDEEAGVNYLSGITAWTMTAYNEEEGKCIAPESTTEWNPVAETDPITNQVSILKAKTINKNGRYCFWAQDKVGNVSLPADITIDKLDITSPFIADIEKDENDFVNYNYNIMTIFGDEISDISAYAVVNDLNNPLANDWVDINDPLLSKAAYISEGADAGKYELTYTVKENSLYCVWAKDKAKNTISKCITIDNIDKAAPTFNITGNPTNWTSNPVKLQITLNDNLSGAKKYIITSSSETPNEFTEEYTGKFELTYYENTSFYIHAIDGAGNSSYEHIEITYYDADELILDIDVASIDEENNTITVTATSTKEVYGITPAGDGWNFVYDGVRDLWIATKVFNESALNYQLTIKDRSENTVSKAFSVIFPGDEVEEFRVDILSYTPDEFTPAKDKVIVAIATNRPIAEDLIPANCQSITNNNPDSTASLYECAFTDNVVNQHIIVEDAEGNQATSELINISWIDKINPEVKITPIAGGWTSNNVNIEIEVSDAASDTSYQSGVVGWARTDYNLTTGQCDEPTSWTNITKTNSLKFNAYSASDNGTYCFWAIDKSERISEVATIEITGIDKSYPSISAVSGIPTGWTNTPFTITATASDSGSGVASWIVTGSSSAPGGIWPSYDALNGISHLVTEDNTTYYIHVKDYAGNVTTKPVTIGNKFDKASPTINVTGNPTIETKEDVYLSVSISDSLSGVKSYAVTVNDSNAPVITSSEWKAYGSAFVKTVSENATYYFHAIDNAGNITTKTVDVTKIDRKAPTLVVEPNITVPTQSNVTVTITSNEDIYNPTAGWTKVNDRTYTKIFDDNYSLVFSCTDKAGNTASKTVSVSNIDRVKPNVNIDPFASTYPTNGLVDITSVLSDNVGLKGYKVVFNNAAQPSSFDALANVTSYNLTYKASNNGTYYIWAIDRADNVSLVKSINVSHIDKTAPSISIIGSNPAEVIYGNSYNDAGATAYDTYDGSVSVSTTGLGSINTNVSGASYTVTYTACDRAGNCDTKTRTVNVTSATASSTIKSKCNFTDKYGGCYLKDITNSRNDNYVWYSGMLWRAYKVNSDGTIKLITEDSISSFAYGPTNYFGSSDNYANQWLNNNFWDSLNKTKVSGVENRVSVVANTNYCISEHFAEAKHISPTYAQLTEEEAVHGCRVDSKNPSDKYFNVGLITIDEYVLAGGQKSYLNTGDAFFTSTVAGGQGTWIWSVEIDGSTVPDYSPTNNAFGIRPVITVNNNVTFYQGNGSKNNPYRITGDESASGGNLSARPVIGEYVTFGNNSNNNTWRVQSIDKSTGEVKLILNDYYKSSASSYYFTSYGNNFDITDTTGVGYKLNNTVKTGLFNNDSTLLGYLSSSSKYYITSYKKGANPISTSLLKPTPLSGNGLIGLPVFGDILSARGVTLNTRPVSETAAWTLTYDSADTAKIWVLNSWGSGKSYPKTGTEKVGVIPVITLNSSVKIQANQGNGTPYSPYKLTK